VEVKKGLLEEKAVPHLNTLHQLSLLEQKNPS
jgi:hypothetical protein